MMLMCRLYYGARSALSFSDCRMVLVSDIALYFCDLPLIRIAFIFFNVYGTQMLWLTVFPIKIKYYTIILVFI